jgi:nitric oxide reductase NorQ protein
VTMALDYLPPEAEQAVVRHEAGVTAEIAERLVRAATALRRAEDAGVKEVPSTRLLVAAARLMAQELPEPVAVELGLLNPLSSSGFVNDAMHELLRASGLGAGDGRAGG